MNPAVSNSQNCGTLYPDTWFQEAVLISCSTAWARWYTA